MTDEPRSPPIDETMMIEPPLRSIMPGTTALISQWLDRMLLSSTLRNCSSLMPAIGP